MTDFANTDTTPRPTLQQRIRAIRDGAFDRLLNGDMKDVRGPDGLTFIQKFAKQLFEDPSAVAKLSDVRNPLVKAAVERATALNAPKLALLDLAERTLPGRRRGSERFWSDLPYCIARQEDGTWQPLNRQYGWLPPNKSSQRYLKFSASSHLN
jgi:hypothetical protein